MDLYRALASISKPDDMARFLRDLCTPSELREFEARWAAARLLDAGTLSYRDIAQQVGTSTTTVTRVARFLNSEPHQGYRLVLKQKGKR